MEDWVYAATALAWGALGLALVRVRLHDGRLPPWLYVGIAFCALRVVDFLVVRPGHVQAPQAVMVLDLLLLLTLVLAVLATDRLRRSIEREQDVAQHARAEYSRALLDYTQLVRHRIANPLTAVIGGAQTMLDLDLPEQTRRRLLEAILDSARRLERVALHPERVGQEEMGLEPSPAPLAEPAARRALEREGGEVESDFRDANAELVEALPGGERKPISFVCECSARDCAQPVVMSLLEYDAVRVEDTQFVVAPGHDVPAIEDVVDRRPGWWVVRKHGPAAGDAKRRAGRLSRLRARRSDRSSEPTR